MRVTDTFYVPSPRPDKDSKWVDKNNNGLDMLKAIYYNLQRGADALKVELGKMSDAAVNLANKPLTKTLDALCNSKDLLTQVSKKEE